jgi:3-hydroxybutyryl-CoA dehydrogenase
MTAKRSHYRRRQSKTTTNIITYTDIKDEVVGVDLEVEATENID